MKKTTVATLLLAGTIALLAACGTAGADPPATPAPIATQPVPPPPAPAPVPTPGTQPAAGNGGITIAAHPGDIAVLVNKSVMLPPGYRPDDLVEPNVRFIFKEKDEKRLMRREAAAALERMFAGAEKDGIYLAGVSGFRSYETQEALFQYYVKTQGEAEARRYSAEPGHSEHQTGLAMDVSGSTGRCAAEDCFADSPEAHWLAQHAPEYGFIIRYPKGKEAVTGYAYEPWHVRYVGVDLAKRITASGLTLDEYLGQGGPAVAGGAAPAP